jgi:dTDP-4-dehydrorhamnose reductase
VRSAHAGATIARIGWQIDPTQPGNNMLMALDQWQASQGHVGASRRWKPACSFMADTAQALADLLRQPVAGIVHLDSNAEEAHSFLDIVLALQATFDRPHWRVQPLDDYVHDQRLVGAGPRFAQLARRLPHLTTPAHPPACAG